MSFFCCTFAVAKVIERNGRQKWKEEMQTKELSENKKAAVWLLCEPAGARTQDPILKRDVLDLLSY